MIEINTKAKQAAEMREKSYQYKDLQSLIIDYFNKKITLEEYYKQYHYLVNLV